MSVCEVPDDYLIWLDSIELKDRLRAAVAAELKFRGLGDSSWNPPHSQPAVIRIEVEADLIPALKQIVDVGFKTLASANHPDRGGSHEAMLSLNAAVSAVRAQLTQLAGGRE